MNCIFVLDNTMFKSPTPVASFGPNGTHWPHLLPTPFPFDDTIPNKISVACSWDAIKNAIQNVTQEQVNEGVIIFVAPGGLRGNGASSGSTAVLKGIGNPNWGKRITVCPRDGYGSIKVTNSMKCEDVSNVCFAMFQIEKDFNFRGCRNAALAWSTYTEWLGGYGSKTYTTSKVEFTEVVREKSLVKDGDGFDVYTAGGRIEGWLLDGCYLAPNFRVAGSSSHADTFQFAATSGGSYGNMFFKNCAVFSANNCSIQTGNVDGMDLDHCMIASSNKSLSRYPRLAGGDQGGVNAAFNGSGKNFKISNSYVFGNLAINTRDAPRVWNNVTNTFADRTYGGVNVPLEGAWLSATENFDLDKRCPIPTQSYLKSVWTGSPVVLPPVDPPTDPPIDPPVEPKPDPEPVGPGEYIANDSFVNIAATGNKFTFKVKPLAAVVDAVIGVGLGIVDEYKDLAATVQFFTDGQIHVRNGGSYGVGLLGYIKDQTYDVEMIVDFAAKTYTVKVDDVEIAKDFTFRTEQAEANSIDTLTFMSSVGSVKVGDIVSGGVVVDPPVDPPVGDDVAALKAKIAQLEAEIVDLKNNNILIKSRVEAAVAGLA